MEKIHKFEKEKIISFSNRTELIHFVSKYLTLEYKDHLEFWRISAVDTPREANYWRRKMELELPKFEEAIAIILRKKLRYKRRINITYKSAILKKVFKMAEIWVHPEGCFSANVKYKINKLVFKKVVMQKSV